MTHVTGERSVSSGSAKDMGPWGHPRLSAETPIASSRFHLFLEESALPCASSAPEEDQIICGEIISRRLYTVSHTQKTGNQRIKQTPETALEMWQISMP